MVGRTKSCSAPGLAGSTGWLAYACFAAFSIASFALVQNEVADPYMDEPFHIPQAQRYCRGDYWTYDPKLTTPPGLYLLSTVPIKLLRLPCSVTVLRSTNLALLLALPILLADLMDSFRPRAARPTSTLIEGVCIALFPPLWFFGLLYYTDVGSVVLVLASWAAARRGRHFIASLLGLASLTFRQTNIIWLGFVAGCALLDRCAEVSEIGQTVAVGKDHLIREQKLAADYGTAASLLATVFELPRVVLANFRRFLPLIAYYAPTFLAFAAFVRWNGGIVLGHQEYHGVSLHLPQSGYFIGFATALGGVKLLDVGVRRFVRVSAKDALGSPRQVLMTSALVGLTTLGVKHFTIAHPFLLADNRHYAFYFWRRVINAHPLARYVLGLGYVACAILWGGRLVRTQPPLPLILFVLCTFATLTPTPLIEPRYFLTPFVILRILASRTSPPHPVDHADTPDAGARRISRFLSLEAAWYAAVNTIVLGVFVLVKFEWPGEEGWQRFMW